MLGADGRLQFSDSFEQLISIKVSQPHIALIDPVESLRKVGLRHPGLHHWQGV